ncbi:hypothetical protein CHS0354_038937 [Potamilus streckersoni]|uniref:Pinin n=1 Tax=Potamilus streckersoni TaxID=2493646 RepID=A0AAE0S0W3_9BIVA|nr:hypothetical protein CHS0354_038937 [Potamilus streckersoni]
MADAVRGFSALEQELQKTRESLKDVDENIKKLIGRDPAEQRPGPQRRAAEPRGRERIFNIARRGTLEEDGPQAKRRGAIGDPFSRLGSRLGPIPTRDEGRRGADSGEDEDLEDKPTISSVVSTPKETRTRQTSIEEQNKDVSGKARNKRMFGVLIGTLQRFKTEAVEAKEKEERRKEIEKKLEEKFKQEKEEIIRERRLLFQERRQKQWKIRLLEQKMELAQNHESWEQETRKLACFIRTKAKPHIFYSPTSMNPELDSKLKSTEKIIEEMILERRRKLELEIEELMIGSQKEGEGEEEEYMEEEQEGEEEADADREEGEIIERKRVKIGGEEKENMRENSSRNNKSKSESSNKEIRKSSRERESNISSREHDQKHNKTDKGKKRSSREREHRRSSRDKEGRHSSREREKKSSRSRERDRDGDREKRRTSGDREKRRSSGDREKREHRRSGRDETKENKKMRSISGKVSKNEEEYDKEHFASKSKKSKAGGEKYEKKEKVWAPMEDEEEEEMDAGGGGGTEKKTGGEGVASKESIVQEKESERAEERTSVPDSQQLAMGLEHEEMDYEN